MGRAQPFWALGFSSQIELGPTIWAHLIFGSGLDLEVESPKLGLNKNFPKLSACSLVEVGRVGAIGIDKMGELKPDMFDVGWAQAGTYGMCL